MPCDFNFTGKTYTYSPDYDFGPEGISYYYILKGSSNITSIWADSSAGPNSGKFYASSTDTLSIIDIENNSIHDWYTQTHIGRSNDSLDNNDIVDINKGQ